MSTAGRRKGATFETDLLKHLRAHGLDAERLRLTGAKDEGDLAVTYYTEGVDRRIGRQTLLLEAKAEQKINLSGYVHEAQLEAVHYAVARTLNPAVVHPVAVVKKRNASIGQAYAVMALDDLLELIA